MGKNISKAIIWLVVHAIAFFVLVWILLGMGPSETYHKIAARVMSVKNGTVAATNSITKTAGDMGRVANHHLNEANDRIHGKDPYQDYNSTLDANVRQGNNQ